MITYVHYRSKQDMAKLKRPAAAIKKGLWIPKWVMQFEDVPPKVYKIKST